MTKTASGLKSLFLATSLAFSAGAMAQEEIPTVSQTPEQSTDPAIKTIKISKAECPAGDLNNRINPERVTIIFDVDLRNQHMRNMRTVLQAVEDHYTTKVKVPLDIMFLIPGSSTDIKAACWLSSFPEGTDAAIVFDKTLLQTGEVSHNRNLNLFNAVMALSYTIELSQTLAQQHLFEKARSRPIAARNLTITP